ncbi:MAG: hypothetical protein WCS42_03480 [Verrucomicrobiota bacterium]
MNATLVKSPPPGDFTYISALNTGWHMQLHSLIAEKKPITYDFFPLRKFPDDVLEQVTQHGYQHLILENDRWQHFFIPPANEFT